MSGKCAVPSCAAFEDDPTYVFFELRPDWVQHCGLAEHTNEAGLKICEQHFSSSDFAPDVKDPSVRRLRSQAVPMRNLDGPAVVISMQKFQQRILFEVDKNLKAKKQASELENELKELTRKMQVLNRRIDKKNVEVRERKKKLDALRKKATIKDRNMILSKVFSDAQVNYLMGRRKVVWSDDDMATAFSLRHMSSRVCYLYLKRTLNIPLPSLASVQKWAASK